MNIKYIGNNSLFESTFEYSTVEECIKWCKNVQILCLDVETNHTRYWLGDIIMLQIGNEEIQWVIDTRVIPIYLFKSILESKVIIGHNLSFEKKWLKKYGINLSLYIGEEAGCYDTMLAEARLTQGNFQGLKLSDLVRKYCEINLNKAEQTNFLGYKGLFTESQIIYGANDIKYLSDIKSKQILQLNETGIFQASKLENLYLHVIADMEYNGIPLDKKSWLENSRIENENKLDIENKLDNYIISKFPDLKFPCSIRKFKGKEILEHFQYDLFNPDLEPVRNTKINWKSSKQKIKIFNKLDISVKNKEGKLTSDIKDLQKVNSKEPNEFLNLLIDHGRTCKIISTYGESFINNYYREDNGRVMSSFFPVLDTGRTSSGSQDKNNKKTKFWNPTANTQNQPQQFRKFYKAKEGHKFITCDYSSQESRVLADQSQDKNLIDFYLNGGADLHAYTAERMFKYLNGKSLDEIKNLYKKERQLCKSINFSIAYGGNELTIADNGGIPLEDAKKLYIDYLIAFSGLNIYFKKQKQFIINHGYALIDNITGARAYVKEYEEYKWLKSQNFEDLEKSQIKRMYILKGDIERFGLNAPIQGLSANMSKLAGVYIYQEIINHNLQNKMEIVNMCHDEYDIISTNEFSEHAAKITKDCMEKSGKVFCKTIPIVAEVIISNKWEK